MEKAKKIIEFEKEFLLKNPSDNVSTNFNYLNSESLRVQLLIFFNLPRFETEKKEYVILKKKIEKYVELLDIINLKKQILKDLSINSLYIENVLKFYIRKRISGTSDEKCRELIKYQIFSEKIWNDDEKQEFIEDINNFINNYLSYMQKNNIEL